MWLMKKLLFDNRGEVTVAEPTNPEPVVETPAEPVAKTPAEPATPAEPVAEPEPTVVPLAALKDEKRKRREAVESQQKLAEENAYLRGKLEAGPAAAAPVASTPQSDAAPVKPVKPKAENYDDWEAFERADAMYDDQLEKYQEEVITYRVQETVKKTAATIQQHTAREQVASTFKERLAKASETDPELVQIVANYHLPNSPYHVALSDTMAEVVMESEVGPEMLRHLKNNPKVAERIAALPTVAAAREMGKIEVTLANAPAAPVKKASSAPEPITTITPVGTVKEFDPETASMEDYYRIRTAQLYGRKKT